ncbi:ATP-binding cassette domain-containing protein [Candidatus Latescibacterota bacterium]
MVLKAEHLALKLSEESKTLFRDISLELDAGEMGIVCGRAGAGKTALGIALCGFLPLWAGSWKLSGEIELLGKPIKQGKFRNDLGIVLENPYSQASGMKRIVREELAFPLECRGVPPAKMYECIYRSADMFGITHLLKRKVRNLSGGELQRVIIASALISGPRFLFLDRLMTEIDTDFRPQLLEIIASHIKECEGSALVAEDSWLLPEYRFHREFQLGKKEQFPNSTDAKVYKPSGSVREGSGGNALRVESLSFSYGAGSSVINDLSLSIGKGKVVFLTGPNGSGKTTLAKLITGIIKSDSGDIIIDDRSAAAMEQWETMSLVGLALQNPGLHICRKTVREEFLLAEKWGNAPLELSGILGLDRVLDIHPLELTQAEKKRLGLALAYGKKRKLVILDEPSQYQDVDGFTRIAEAISFIASEGIAVLIITHDPRFYRVFPGSAAIRLSQEDSC